MSSCCSCACGEVMWFLSGRLQLQNQGSHESIPDVVNADAAEHAYGLPSVDVGKTALL